MDENDKDPLSEYANWKERSEGEEQTQDPKELFKQVTHVSLCISYDMIDKIRFWEKETLKLSDEEIGGRYTSANGGKRETRCLQVAPLR